MIRRWTNRAICRLLGHLMVDIGALWKPVLMFVDKNTEAVCIRCGYQEQSMYKFVDLFFEDTPFQKKMREQFQKEAK